MWVSLPSLSLQFVETPHQPYKAEGREVRGMTQLMPTRRGCPQGSWGQRLGGPDPSGTLSQIARMEPGSDGAVRVPSPLPWKEALSTGPLRRLGVGADGGSPRLPALPKPERGSAPAPPPELSTAGAEPQPQPRRRALCAGHFAVGTRHGTHSALGTPFPSRKSCKSCCPARRDALRPAAAASSPRPGPRSDLGSVGPTGICR